MLLRNKAVGQVVLDDWVPRLELSGIREEL
jgi:hypothetical protein